MANCVRYGIPDRSEDDEWEMGVVLAVHFSRCLDMTVTGVPAVGPCARPGLAVPTAALLQDGWPTAPVGIGASGREECGQLVPAPRRLDPRQGEGWGAGRTRHGPRQRQAPGGEWRRSPGRSGQLGAGRHRRRVRAPSGPASARTAARRRAPPGGAPTGPPGTAFHLPAPVGAGPRGPARTRRAAEAGRWSPRDPAPGGAGATGRRHRRPADGRPRGRCTAPRPGPGATAPGTPHRVRASLSPPARAPHAQPIARSSARPAPPSTVRGARRTPATRRPAPPGAPPTPETSAGRPPGRPRRVSPPR